LSCDIINRKYKLSGGDMVEKSRLIEILEQFKSKKIGVIGDMMLDEYIIGNVTRISPEAPVPVVEVKEERFVLGGAANVINNLYALGAKVYAMGIIGKDNNGKRLKDELQNKNVDYSSLIEVSDRPTIMKQRVLASNQQLLRLDWEKKNPIGMEIENKLIENYSEIIEELDGIIISDYDKGLLTSKLAKKVIEIANLKNKIVIVDPKPSNSENYKGATSMTPNLKESSECFGRQLPETLDEVIKIGQEIREKLNLDHLLMTRSEKGMSIFIEDDVIHIPTFAKEVYDVTGAGDTVISIYTLALATGASKEEAAKIANTGAGVVVGRVGTSTVSQQEIIEFYDEIYNS
jgi:rfaE bifunctional protein kinase chain/domain